MPLATWRKAARRARVGILAVPFLVGACNNPVDGRVACTANFVYGILGTAIDASTSANITGGAYMVVNEGSFRDSVRALPGGQLLAAGERAGVYTVKIGHTGYFAFTQNNVIVREDECHVIPVTLQARLTPNSGPN